ncbi:type II secretion system F family protein [Sulfurimonas sp. MAG313]|nr:type II secretion system F family protein [Sulfurimonas sp. MAG313]MDF1881892.1 type II secretion system F family protein [Sulfurimonas sp. MAG313]
MKYFSVTIINRGKRETMGLRAEDKKEAHFLAKVKFSGVILKVIESSPPIDQQFKAFKDNLTKNFKKKKIKQDALIAAIRQMAVMTNAGISIHDTLYEIADSTEDKRLKQVFSKIGEDINAGLSMSQSVENFRYELGNLTLAMVQLGEKTGNMAEALYDLATMLEEIRSNFIKFKKAMAYPRNVMIAMAVAFTILISYVVPEFKKIFEELGAELPLPTQILLALEVAVNQYGMYFLVIIIAAFVSIRFTINHYTHVRYKFHQLLLRLIIIKKLIHYGTLNRFMLVFSALVHAGIPIADSLDAAIDMIDNLPLKAKLKTVRSAVEKGNTLNQGLKDTGLFENMIIQMVAAGEQSGQLDAMMEKVTEYYKMKFDGIIDGLSEAIEPVILFFIAGMILLLALGIFLPMWDMGKAVNN